MISATMLGKILGMLRDMLLAYYYGTGVEAQAYLVASRLPLNFFDFALGAMIGSAFIPTFNDVLKKQGKERGLKFANEFVNGVVYIAMILAAVGMMLAPILIRVTAGGLNSVSYALAVDLTRIMFPMMIFTAMAFAFVGILQSFGEFNVPAAISVVANLIMIVYLIFFSPTFGIQGLALAMVIGWFLQMFIQVPFLRKRGFVYKPILKFTCTELKTVGVIVGPILISTWVQPINVFVNTYLASGIDGGPAVVVLEYANKVFMIIAGVFILAVTNLVFPSLARFLATKEIKKFTELLTSGLRMVLFFMAPVTAGIIVFSQPVIRVIYQRGAFTSAEATMTAEALAFYTIGIVFFGFREMLNKAFYAYGDSKRPMKIAIIGITFNIVASIVLVRLWGTNGLAIAASISAVLMAVMLAYSFNRHIHKVFGKDEWVYSGKVVLNTVIMGLVIKGLYTWLLNTYSVEGVLWDIIRMVLCTLVGVIIYFATARVLKIEIPKLTLDRGEGA